jgi:hypothetical protein
MLILQLSLCLFASSFFNYFILNYSNFGFKKKKKKKKKGGVVAA